MVENLPYVATPGNIRRVLAKIQEAATPQRFTQDFLQTKLGMSGGGARPLIPFLKRIGFLASDGSPTDLYKSFRNSSQSGAAAAAALRIGYKTLFEANEYAHELQDARLKGLLVQLTGEQENSRVLQLTISSFKALREFSNFDEQLRKENTDINTTSPPEANKPMIIPEEHPHRENGVGLNLSYTINLNLPATSDIAVFDAIFKSLKANLLKS